MTEAQRIQYDRFTAAGYEPGDAAMLIKRGVWLGTTAMTEQEIADVRVYRAERERQDAESEAALCELATQAQELDMGY